MKIIKRKNLKKKKKVCVIREIVNLFVGPSMAKSEVSDRSGPPKMKGPRILTV
jgi:hypothetical protein